MVFIIGIFGKMGSGKSSAAEFLMNDLEGLGKKCHLISMDKIGHSALKEPEVMNKVKFSFGSDVFSEKFIDRKKLGKIVFSDSLKMNKLNSIIHPILYSKIINEIHLLKSNYDFIIIEGALLFFLKLNDICDMTLFIDLEYEKRMKRLLKRNPDLHAEDIKKRIDIQEKISFIKKDFSDYYYNNSENLSSLRKFINRLSFMIVNG